MTVQMRRTALSIPCNIAGGRKRGTENEFKHFLRIAFGSAAELETQLELSRALKYGRDEEHGIIFSLLDEVMRMLNKMTDA